MYTSSKKTRLLSRSLRRCRVLKFRWGIWHEAFKKVLFLTWCYMTGLDWPAQRSCHLYHIQPSCTGSQVKPFKKEISHVFWSPSKKLMLFCCCPYYITSKKRNVSWKTVRKNKHIASVSFLGGREMTHYVFLLLCELRCNL